MDKLTQALTSGDWLHAVDAASVQRHQIDPAALTQPTATGAPLLVDWWQRNIRRPDTAWRKQGESREFFRSLFWRLVDAGFDVHTRWTWSQAQTHPAPPPPDGLAKGETDLMDLVLDLGDTVWLSDLEARWGRPWTAEDLSGRSRCRHEALEPDADDAFPCLHYDVAVNRRPMVTWWIRRGVDINLQDAHGQTALFHAREPEMVKFLLARGADPDLRDQEGRLACERWLEREHWKGPPYVKGSRLVFALFPKNREGVPPAVLARAVALEIARGEYVSGGMRTALVALRPHLGTPLAAIPCSGGHGQKPDPFAGLTLLEIAVRQAWAESPPKNLEALAWLAANTPRRGLERWHDFAGLSFFALQPRDAVRMKTGHGPARVRFPDALSAATRLVDSDIIRVPALRDRLVSAVLDLAGAAIEFAAAPDRPSYVLSTLSPLVDPPLDRWLVGEAGSPSLLAQALAWAADVGGRGPIRPTHESLSNALMAHAVSSRPIPLDTLAPAVRLLSAVTLSARDAASGVRLTECFWPSWEDQERVRTQGNWAVALAWWINRGATEARLGAQALELPAPAADWDRATAALQGAPEPWPAWAAMWNQRRLEAALAVTAEPRPQKLRSRM